MNQYFSEHQIVSSIVQKDFGTWLLMKPGDSHLWCRITSADRMLTVTGDFNPVTFAYGQKDPISNVLWIGNHPTLDSYVLQKASIGTGWDRVWTHSVPKAIERIKEIIEEVKSAEDEDSDSSWAGVSKENLDSAFSALSSGLEVSGEFDGFAGCFLIQKAILDEPSDLDWEELGDLGAVPRTEVKFAHQALQRLADLLKESQ